MTLAYGRRYGLVGRNGLGKTTLLRMISRYVMWHFIRNFSILHPLYLPPGEIVCEN
jgi:ATP-binding cassette subfamily F protein 3